MFVTQIWKILHQNDQQKESYAVIMFFSNIAHLGDQKSNILRSFLHQKLKKLLSL